VKISGGHRCLSKESEHTHSLSVGGQTWLLAEFDKDDSGYRIRLDGVKVPVRIIEEPGIDRPELVAEINGRVFVAKVLEKNGGEYVVRLNGRIFTISLDAVQATARGAKAEETSHGPVLVSAPMSGRVVSLNISTQSQVTSGQSLVVLEAMKMQNDIAAPKAGVVKEVYVQAGALVKAGDKLCLLQ